MRLKGNDKRCDLAINIWLFCSNNFRIVDFLMNRRYRVILKKVSFGYFRIILDSKERKKFTIESKDKGLSLSKFS